MKIEKMIKYKFQILIILFSLLVVYNIYKIAEDNAYKELYLYYAREQEFQNRMKKDIEILKTNGLKYRVETKVKATATDEIPLTVLLVKRKEFDKASLYTLVNRLNE